MKSLVLHPVTRRQIEEFVTSPSHAVLLSGPVGSGKKTVANKLAELVLELSDSGLEVYPYKIILGSTEGKTIGIEAIRELEHFMSLKVPSPKQYNRVVIIQDAHLLGTEAQNALLKTLEEPPEGALIILGVQSEQTLLPTVRSRAQVISVKRPELAAIEAYFADNGFNKPEVTKAYAVSGGLPGLMHALLENTEHPLMQATERARRLLSQTAYERLLSVDELSKQRDLAIDTTLILQQMAHVSLQKASGSAAARWQAILAASYEAGEALINSGQPKLALTKLMLSL